MADDATRQRAAFDRVLSTQHKRSGKGAPIRDAFLTDPRRPLAGLMNGRNGSGGGRGGKTRILLYLSLLWVAGAGDHTTTRPARFWADLLGLPDPMGAGGRAIRNSWEELEHRGFVTISRADISGDTPTIQALREDGSRRGYTIPEGRGEDTYRRIPQTAWRNLFHSKDLTGSGLTMYLISLRTHGQAREQPFTFPRAYFHDTYGIGDSTRKAGLRNLVDLGVLEREGTSREDGTSSNRRRGRTEYSIMHLYQPPSPTTRPTAADNPPTTPAQADPAQPSRATATF